MVSGASIIKKLKNKDSLDNLRKSHSKTYPLDPRSRKKFITYPDPGSKE
jgi:hypothetical protein